MGCKATHQGTKPSQKLACSNMRSRPCWLQYRHHRKDKEKWETQENRDYSSTKDYMLLTIHTQLLELNTQRGLGQVRTNLCSSHQCWALGLTCSSRNQRRWSWAAEQTGAASEHHPPWRFTFRKRQTQTRKPQAYVSTMGHHQIRRTTGKRPKRVWYPLRPGLGFEHTAEHGQRLHIPELTVMSQPGEEEVRGEKTSQEENGGRMLAQSWRLLP